MSLWNAFASSNAFDPASKLPLCPTKNNPWAYLAYAVKIMRAQGLTGPEELNLKAMIKAQADRCRIRAGLFDRYPLGWGGIFSHDEIAGMAYLSPDLARELLIYLTEMDGIYCNKPNEMNPNFPDEFNVFRFPWMRPFLQACSPGFHVSLISQIVYGLFLFFDGFIFSRRDASGRLKIWITLGRLEPYFISGLFVLLWRMRMKRMGITLKECLRLELPEFPIFADNAPTDF